MPVVPLTNEDHAWLDANAGADTAALRLRHRGDAHLSWLALQLDCRRKAAGKLDGWPVGSEFVYPNTLAVEQCTSTEIAALHSSLIAKGERVADMTAGLGIDAMTLARKASSVLAFDIIADNVEALHINAASAGLTNFTPIEADSGAYLHAHADLVFDTIFIDPARRADSGRRLYSITDCRPNVKDLLPLLKERTKRLIVKASPMIDIADTVSVFAPCDTTIYIYGTRRECKEVVAVVDFGKTTTSPDTTVTVEVPGSVAFTFTLDEERSATVNYGIPMPGDTLVEPWAVVVKSGAFKTFANRHNLIKIAPQTHLYFTSHGLDTAHILADCWKVDEILPMGKATIKRLTGVVAQVAVRHFAMTADDLRRRLRAKEDPTGQHKIFGITANDGTRHIFVATRQN